MPSFAADFHKQQKVSSLVIYICVVFLYYCIHWFSSFLFSPFRLKAIILRALAMTGRWCWCCICCLSWDSFKSICSIRIRSLTSTLTRLPSSKATTTTTTTKQNQDVCFCFFSFLSPSLFFFIWVVRWHCFTTGVSNSFAIDRELRRRRKRTRKKREKKKKSDDCANQIAAPLLYIYGFIFLLICIFKFVGFAFSFLQSQSYFL